MKTIKLTEAQQTVIKDYFKAYNKADFSSLKVFEVCLEYFQTNKGQKRATLKSNLIKEFKGIFKNIELPNSFVTRLKKIIAIASVYRNFNINYKNEEGEALMYYKTIEDIVKLLQFISDNTKELGSDVFPKVRKDLEEVITGDTSKKVAYNNTIQAKITEIKRQYNIKGDEDALEFKGTLNDFVKIALSKWSKEEILKALEA